MADIGKTVGSVSVKVMPDTTDFGKKLKADLEKFEKSKDAQLNITNIDVDYTALKRAAVERLRELNAELKSDSRLQVKFRASIDQTGMLQAVRDARKKLQALADEQQKITYRAEAAAAKVDAELDETSLDRVNAEIDAFIRRNSPKTVVIAPDLSAAATAAADARLTALTRTRTITIKPDVDQSAMTVLTGALARLSGARLVGGIFSEFANFFSNIDKSVPLISGITLAVLGLAGTVIAATGDLFTLARALGQIAPAALALPGIFGGIAIGVGATFAALKDFNKEFPDFKDKLTALQNSMSANFWAQAQKPMRNMIDVLFPQISTQLDKTSTALGKFFAALSTSFKTQLSGSFTGMFSDLNQSISIMAGHTNAIAQLFRIFGEAGAKELPALAKTLGDAADQFANFMSQAQKSGQLDTWIDTGITRLKSLGDVLVNVGKLFHGLGVAADNATAGDALSNLAGALDQAQKAVNSSGFQKKFTGVLEAAHQSMDNISKVAGPAFQKFWSTMATTLETVLPKVGDTIGTLFKNTYTLLGSKQVQKGFTDLVTGIDNGVHKLTPMFGVLADKTGAVLDVLGQLADLFGGVFADSVKSAAPVMTTILEALSGLLKAVNAIPAPLLDMAVKIGVAAVAFTKLRTAMLLLDFGSLSGSLTGVVSSFRNLGPIIATTRSDIALMSGSMGTLEAASLSLKTNPAATGLVQLGEAAKQAAGIGGMLALINGLGKGQTAMGAFETVAGAAMLGFSVGGPWGAAIGAGVGGLAELVQSFHKTTNSAVQLNSVLNGQNAIETANESLSALKQTLNKVTGAYTAASKAAIYNNLQTSGVIEDAQKVGISGKELVAAVSGNAKALDDIGKKTSDAAQQQAFNTIKTKDGTAAAFKYASALAAIRDVLPMESQDHRKQAESIQAESIATGKLQKVLGLTAAEYAKVPKSIQTDLTLNGLPQTKQQLEAFVAKYGKKSLATATVIAKVDGISTSNAQLQRWAAGTKSVGVTAGANVSNGFKGGVSGPTMSSALNNAMRFATSNSNASSLGFGVGANLGQGVANGITSAQGAADAAADNIVNNTVARLRKAGVIHSPSRKTRDEVGVYLGTGIGEGMKKAQSSVNKSADGVITSVIASMLKQLNGGLNGKEVKGFTNALNHLMGDLPKGLGKVAQSALAGLTTDQKKQLQQAAQDEMKTVQQTVQKYQTKLDKALGQYNSASDKITARINSIKQAGSQLQQTLVQAGQALGDPTALGGGVNIQGIEKQNTFAIGITKRFAADLAKLRGMGLNDTTFMQLVNAGPENGLAAADALVKAGKAGIKKVNQQTAELSKYARQAGITANKQYVQSGMAAAQGFIQGLKAKKKALTAEMKSLANSLVTTVKKELKIHSPSRVFQEIGQFTGQGFINGVKSTQKAANKAVVGMTGARPGAAGTAAFSNISPSQSTSKTINYYAAPNKSLAEDDLFSALDKAGAWL